VYAISIAEELVNNCKKNLVTAVSSYEITVNVKSVYLYERLIIKC
jgi:hypothetical protein